jgi:hypothetical protein
MKTRPIAVEKQNIISHLQSGGRLYLIEDRPYPAPHTVMVIHGNESILVSYSAFVSLNASEQLIPAEKTIIDGKPAQAYTYKG